MPLPKLSYWVYLADAADPVQVDVTHRDQLYAETEMMRAGLPMKAALNLTTAFCWAAMTRAKLYTGPFERFRNVDCAGIEDADRDGVGPVVDPTRPDPVTA